MTGKRVGLGRERIVDDGESFGVLAKLLIVWVGVEGFRITIIKINRQNWILRIAIRL